MPAVQNRYFLGVGTQAVAPRALETLAAFDLLAGSAGLLSAAYTSERVIDLQTRQVRELARVGFVPLAWHPASDTAVGWAFRGDGGFADSYVLLQVAYNSPAFVSLAGQMASTFLTSVTLRDEPSDK